MSIADEIAKMVTGGGEGSRHRATVLRTDNDGTTWVQIPGGADETLLTGNLVDYEPGDEVEVLIQDGRATATANATAPATSARDVERALSPMRASLTQAAEDADAAKLAAKAAQEAAEAASAANQHFWDDTNGAHVTEVEKDAWTDPQSADYHSGHNLLMNSLGILLRKALNNLASITQSAIAFFDGTGNAASNVVASFGTDGAQIGKADKAHATLTRTQFMLTNADGHTTSAVIGTLNDPDTGIVELTERYTAASIIGYDASGYGCFLDKITQFNYVSIDEVKLNGQTTSSYTTPGPSMLLIDGADTGDEIVVRYHTDAEASSAQFSNGVASGRLSFASGTSYATGIAAHAEGNSTASGNYSHSEGSSNEASGIASHTEGMNTVASGYCSHAEGAGSEASNLAAHAEGDYTIASGFASHAEGVSTEASGSYSHAQNYRTIASDNYQTAIGKYNVADNSSALIVGNGTSDSNRSNAYTLDWNGNADYAGEVTAHNGSTAHNLTDKADQADLSALETTVDGMQATTSSSSYTNIASYDENNQYTFPSDGYVFVYVPSSSTAYFTIAGSTGNLVGAIGGVGNYRSTVYVRKGMHGYKNSSITGSITARYYKLG